LFSVNGILIASRIFAPSEAAITTLCFTHAVEGVHDNVLIAGRADGVVMMLSCTDLTTIAMLEGRHQAPVRSIAVHSDHMHIATGDDDGLVISWEFRKKATAS
jgi:WD40 repeat protein